MPDRIATLASGFRVVVLDAAHSGTDRHARRCGEGEVGNRDSALYTGPSTSAAPLQDSIRRRRLPKTRQTRARRTSHLWRMIARIGRGVRGIQHYCICDTPPWNINWRNQDKARFQNPEGLETRVGDSALMEARKRSQNRCPSFGTDASKHRRTLGSKGPEKRNQCLSVPLRFRSSQKVSLKPLECSCEACSVKHQRRDQTPSWLSDTAANW